MPDPTDDRPLRIGWRWLWLRPSRDPQPDCKRPVDLTDPSWGGTERVDPIVPEAVAELARLQAAGDVLVDAAKRATLELGGTDHETVRGQLYDAIVGWLKARMGGINTEGSPCE